MSIPNVGLVENAIVKLLQPTLHLVFEITIQPYIL